MDKLLTYYTLLGVPTNATTEEILKAYRLKAKDYHPDKNGGGQAAHDMFNYLGQAKEWLTDPQKRLQYDYTIGVKVKPGSNNSQGSRPRAEVKSPSTSSGDAFMAGALGLIVGVALSKLFGEDD